MERMKHNFVETIMGSVVVVIAAFFLTYAYKSSGQQTGDVFVYKAQFERIDGLVLGADVKISGVKVGVIKHLSVDPKTFLATVEFSVDETIKLPKDTSAEVIGDGLLGSKFLALVPGGDDEVIASGGFVTHTQSAVSLESMIGQLIFSNKKDGDDKDKGAQTHSATANESKPEAVIAPTPSPTAETPHP